MSTDRPVQASLYTYLQKFTLVYNTIQQEVEKRNTALLQNKCKKNFVCVLYCTFLHKKGGLKEGRAGEESGQRNITVCEL